jgi:hypothetical protein
MLCGYLVSFTIIYLATDGAFKHPIIGVEVIARETVVELYAGMEPGYAGLYLWLRVYLAQLKLVASAFHFAICYLVTFDSIFLFDGLHGATNL